jgi:hypothetical protein
MSRQDRHVEILAQPRRSAQARRGFFYSGIAGTRLRRHKHEYLAAFNGAAGCGSPLAHDTPSAQELVPALPMRRMAVHPLRTAHLHFTGLQWTAF